LTQSAVSHSIKSLEGHLDANLFERLGKRVRLTPAGEAFLPHVEVILSRMKAGQDVVQQTLRPGHGRFRIGATVTISQYVLPSILRELRESFPLFDIAVNTDDSRQLASLLKNGEIDIAVAMKSTASGQFEFHQLFTDQIKMAVSPVHPLASAERILRDDITDEIFIFYDEASETFQRIERIFSEMQGRLRSSLQVGSMAAIKEMAKIGMGVGLLAPWIALEEIAARSLVFRDLPIETPDRIWGIHSRSGKEPTMIESVFTGICQNVVDTLQMRTRQCLETSGKSA
ncbi:MAG: LysR family transcriptional regulator, partial [Verrucomicrobiales bacterium]|nr:LysR family transcriptional regulator [Verrucomicrobiales bacterium]